MKKYVVVRVPTGGMPAVIGAPFAFDTQKAAIDRMAEIEAPQRKTHHTHLEVVPVKMPLADGLAELGILL